MNELIILGMGATRWNCPFDDHSVPIFSCNNGYMQIAEMNGYITMIFMSHENHLSADGSGWAYNYEQLNMLASHGVEIFNIHRCTGLNHKMFPLKRLIKKFETDFFSDTITYMLAYAIDRWTRTANGNVVLRKPYEKHRIRIFGVDMATFDNFQGAGEYQLEKGGVEFWIGYAKGLGIKVEIGGGSFVCKTITGHPYGTKYFKLKDIDPDGLLPKDIEKYLIYG